MSLSMWIAGTLGTAYGSRNDPFIWLVVAICGLLGFTHYRWWVPAIVSVLTAAFYFWLSVSRFGPDNSLELTWIVFNLLAKLLICYAAFIIGRLFNRPAPSPPAAGT
jgi:hypothetical protein